MIVWTAVVQTETWWLDQEILQIQLVNQISLNVSFFTKWHVLLIGRKQNIKLNIFYILNAVGILGVGDYYNLKYANNKQLHWFRFLILV